MIGDANVSTLVKKWSGDVHRQHDRDAERGRRCGRPPDTKGNLWDFDAATGKVRWRRLLGSYTGLAGDSTRNTAVDDGRVVFGDKQGGGHVSRMVAVNAGTGACSWSTGSSTAS